MPPLGVAMIGIAAGPLLCAAYLWNGRLWLPIGLHAGWNAMQSSFWVGNVSGTGDAPGVLSGTFAGPAWLTGSTAGIEGSLLTGAFCLIATGLLLA